MILDTMTEYAMLFCGGKKYREKRFDLLASTSWPDEESSSSSSSEEREREKKKKKGERRRREKEKVEKVEKEEEGHKRKRQKISATAKTNTVDGENHNTTTTLNLTITGGWYPGASNIRCSKFISTHSVLRTSILTSRFVATSENECS